MWQTRQTVRRVSTLSLSSKFNKKFPSGRCLIYRRKFFRLTTSFCQVFFFVANEFFFLLWFLTFPFLFRFLHLSNFLRYQNLLGIFFKFRFESFKFILNVLKNSSFFFKLLSIFKICSNIFNFIWKIASLWIRVVLQKAVILRNVISSKPFEEKSVPQIYFKRKWNSLEKSTKIAQVEMNEWFTVYKMK